MPKRTPKPIDPYLADLSSPDDKVRREAVKALRQSRNPDAYSHLVAALRDTSVGVVYHAIRGLEALGDPRAIPELLAIVGQAASCDVCDEVGSALESFGTAAVPALIEALKSSQPRARAVAVAVLRRIGDPAAVEPILTLLDDPHHFPLSAALAALWAFKDLRAADALAAFLDRPLDSIPSEEPAFPAFGQKGTAALALAELGDPRAIPTLAESFEHDLPSGYLVIQQLGKIADPRVRPLIQRYIDANPDGVYASHARATLEHLAAKGL